MQNNNNNHFPRSLPFEGATESIHQGEVQPIAIADNDVTSLGERATSHMGPDGRSGDGAASPFPLRQMTGQSQGAERTAEAADLLMRMSEKLDQLSETVESVMHALEEERETTRELGEQLRGLQEAQAPSPLRAGSRTLVSEGLDSPAGGLSRVTRQEAVQGASSDARQVDQVLPYSARVDDSAEADVDQVVHAARVDEPERDGVVGQGLSNSLFESFTGGIRSSSALIDTKRLGQLTSSIKARVVNFDVSKLREDDRLLAVGSWMTQLQLERRMQGWNDAEWRALVPIRLAPKPLEWFRAWCAQHPSGTFEEFGRDFIEQYGEVSGQAGIRRVLERMRQNPKESFLEFLGRKVALAYPAGLDMSRSSDENEVCLMVLRDLAPAFAGLQQYVLDRVGREGLTRQRIVELHLDWRSNQERLQLIRGKASRSEVALGSSPSIPSQDESKVVKELPKTWRGCWNCGSTGCKRPCTNTKENKRAFMYWGTKLFDDKCRERVPSSLKANMEL